MSLVKDCERSIIRAGRTGDRSAAFRAFALHPLVDSLEAARVLTDLALDRRAAARWRRAPHGWRCLLNQ